MFIEIFGKRSTLLSHKANMLIRQLRACAVLSHLAISSITARRVFNVATKCAHSVELQSRQQKAPLAIPADASRQHGFVVFATNTS